MMGDAATVELPRAATRPRVPDAIASVITDPFTYGDQRIHDAFTWLRENEPFGIVETDAFEPFWLATRHADCRAIATRPEQFRSGGQNIVLTDRAEQQHFRAMLAGQEFPTRHLLQMDPPDHPKYRAIAAELFHARSLDAMTETIRAIAREFIDRMAATGGECDFAKIIAFVYPLRVVMSIIGVPPEDEHRLLTLTQQLMGSRDPEQSRDGVAAQGVQSAAQILAVAAEFDAYFDDLMADRRASPRDDFATIIATARIDGAPMPSLEARSYLQVVATAGHDTTAAVTAGAMIALAQNPAEFAKIKAEPARLTNSLVEEATRWVSPSKITMRTASEDIELCGRQFRKDDWIGLAWVSANRDEAVFADPFTFRADRRPNKLLAYGNGPHVCLGQHLARLEMRILFEELIKRLDHVELAGDTRTLASFMVSGPKTAPIRFRMQ